MAFKQLLNQDFGVLFHIRCLSPMVYIATNEPDEAVAGLKERLSPKKHMLKIVEDVAFGDLKEHVPTRDEIVFVLIRNPADWFGDPRIVEYLSDNIQLRLDSRYLQRLVFIGPPNLIAPKSLRTLIPRIEEGFQLDGERPEPEPPSLEQLGDASKLINEILTNLSNKVDKVPATREKIEAVARVVAHLSPPEIDNTMAQAAIRAKLKWAKEEQGFGVVAHLFMEDPGSFVAETLDDVRKFNGWPVYEVK